MIAAIGVLAFFFSAVSPNDDDIQQEFIQGNKPKQVSVSNHKNGHETPKLGAGRTHLAFASRHSLQVFAGFMRSDFAGDEAASLTRFVSQSIGRAPPTKTS